MSFRLNFCASVCSLIFLCISVFTYIFVQVFFAYIFCARVCSLIFLCTCVFAYIFVHMYILLHFLSVCMCFRLCF